MVKRASVVLASLVLAALATGPGGCGQHRSPVTSGTAGTGGGAGGAGSSSATAGASGSQSSDADTEAGASAAGATDADTCATIDLMTDPDHCGNCDNRCGPTVTCVGGFCGLPPQAFVPRLTSRCGDIDLAIANGRLYWTEKDLGDVVTRDPVTGKLFAFAAGENTPTRISVRGTNVFWLDVATRTLRQKRGDAAVADVLTTATDIHGYVASPDGDTIYYSTENEIDQIAAAGGTPVRVATFGTIGRPTALALDGDTLAAIVDVDGTVAATTLVPGKIAICNAFDMNGADLSVGCVQLAHGLGNVFTEAILLAPGHAIWADGPRLEISESTDASSNMTIGASDDRISGFVAVGDSIVFSTSGDPARPSSGMIYKVPAAPNQALVPLARGQLAPRALVADGKRIYWSTADCVINALDL